MEFDNHEVMSLMQVYKQLCFSKIPFQDKISLTSDLLLRIDDATDYKYTLSRVIYSGDRETWQPLKLDASVQTDPLEGNSSERQNGRFQNCIHIHSYMRKK